MAPDLAKDRGAMLRALVIDAETPQPDRDAGGYAAIQEMRLLQSLGVKLSFIPENLAYLGNYTEALQRMGVECLYAPYNTSIEGLIQSRGADFDFFYITRYSVAIRYIDSIRAAAPQAKIVFCNADLHFLREVRAAIASRNPAMMEKAAATRELELGVIRRADVTLSYTETEAAVIVSHNFDAGRVMRCPWVVEPAPNVAPFEGRSGVAFLGNFRHPPNEEGMVYFLKEIMPGLRERLPGVKLHIFGSNMTDRLREMATEDVVIEGFVERVEEVYDRCRVFVAPLLSGAGIKGKVIGALAAGTPSVVSPLAAEGVGVSAGVEAIVAESP
ncbi:MAG: glycosyl transferase family 2, partial [Deltaproteobacteria bacterium 21-66-5]